MSGPSFNIVSAPVQSAVAKATDVVVSPVNSIAAAVNPTSLGSNLAQTFVAPNIPSVSGVVSSFGGSIGSTLASANLTQGLSGLTTSIKLELPKMGNFPGLDQAGILLGAGPKFVVEKIAKFKSIVPPFAPGLKINMGMVMGALAIIKALSSANPSELLKQLTANIKDDLLSEVDALKQEALDSTGISDIQSQVGGITDQISSATSAVENVATDATSTVTNAVNSAVSPTK